MDDLAKWQVHIEEPVSTTYRGIAVYKLTTWVQGPAMLQALNILENMDLKAMGYNSARYIHALYQTMSLAFADRDFYYGDPYVPPAEPIKGLLSKAYAKERFKQINWAQERSGDRPRRSVSVPGREESVPQAARCLAHDRDAARHRRRHRARPAPAAASADAGQAQARPGGDRGHRPAPGRRSVPRRVHGGHDLDRGRRRQGLGGLGDAERRLGSGGDRRQDRRRAEPADAELRARRGREPVQRRGARAAAALDA